MSYEILFNRALSLHEAGQLDEAERIYRQILETAPEQPDVLNLLGLVAQAKGVQSEACALFYRALKKAPANPAFYYNLAFSLKLDGKYHEALQYFLKVMELKPEMPETYNETALLRQKLGDWNTAKRDFETALRLNPGYGEAAANLAYGYRFENPVKAAEELEKACRCFPDEARGFYYLSLIYLDRGETDKAWTAAGRAKELAPASDEVRVVLGQLSLREHKEDNARVYFEKALLLNPQNIAALSGAALVDAAQGRTEEAEAKYKLITALDENNFEAYNNYAELLYRQKRTAEALELYRKAVIINPNSAEVSNNLGTILKDTADYKEAMGLFMNALLLKPDLEEASVNLAETLVLYAAENRDEALEIAENWKCKMPENVFAAHTLSALKGEKSENNQVYAEKLFDHFADHYELVVQTLGYAVPLVVGRIAGNAPVSVVDLGCGTGLAGEALKSPGRYLIGVDVSQKMLDEAAKKGIYNRLVKADALSFLQENDDFEMIVAADVLGYIGDIAPLIKAARGKTLVFSVETADISPFELAESGRYRHHPGEVVRLLEAEGYHVAVREDLILRYENGEPVKGMVFRAEKV